MWMKFYLVVFAFYLNTTEMYGKDHTNWEMYLSFSQFGNAWGISWSQTCLISLDGSCDCTDHKAAISTESKALQRGLMSYQGLVPKQVSNRSNRHTCKVKILLIMQVCCFFRGCLEHWKRSWKGNPDTMNKI